MGLQFKVLGNQSIVVRRTALLAGVCHLSGYHES